MATIASQEPDTSPSGSAPTKLKKKRSGLKRLATFIHRRRRSLSSGNKEGRRDASSVVQGGGEGLSGTGEYLKTTGNGRSVFVESDEEEEEDVELYNPNLFSMRRVSDALPTLSYGVRASYLNNKFESRKRRQRSIIANDTGDTGERKSCEADSRQGSPTSLTSPTSLLPPNSSVSSTCISTPTPSKNPPSSTNSPPTAVIPPKSPRLRRGATMIENVSTRQRRRRTRPFGLVDSDSDSDEADDANNPFQTISSHFPTTTSKTNQTTTNHQNGTTLFFPKVNPPTTTDEPPRTTTFPLQTKQQQQQQQTRIGSRPKKKQQRRLPKPSAPPPESFYNPTTTILALPRPPLPRAQSLYHHHHHHHSNTISRRDDDNLGVSPYNKLKARVKRVTSSGSEELEGRRRQTWKKLVPQSAPPICGGGDSGERREEKEGLRRRRSAVVGREEGVGRDLRHCVRGSVLSRFDFGDSGSEDDEEGEEEGEEEVVGVERRNINHTQSRLGESLSRDIDGRRIVGSVKGHNEEGHDDDMESFGMAEGIEVNMATAGLSQYPISSTPSSSSCLQGNDMFPARFNPVYSKGIAARSNDSGNIEERWRRNDEFKKPIRLLDPPTHYFSKD